MPSYRPTDTSKGHTYRRKLPWKARVRHNWNEYFLGWYETKEEAVAAEEAFRQRVRKEKGVTR